MIVFLDVDYRAGEAVTAVVALRAWSDDAPAHERVVRVAEPAHAPYQPGEFYVRELPHLLRALAEEHEVTTAVIDGYVWLARARPGLGAHLHERIGARYPVVGIAKSEFRGNDCAIAVHRGTSAHPLFVTAAGMDAALAAEEVARMHGPHRIPTLVRRADRLSREG